MRITGIIGCRNYAHLVGDAMRSFYEQDYVDKRLLVIDDGSVDGSMEAIRVTMGGDPPCPTEVLRVEGHLNQPNGAAWIKNLGIGRAWGDTDAFAFLDADDTYLPGKIARSVDLLKYPYAPVGLVYSDEIVVDYINECKYTVYRPSFSPDNLAIRNCVGGNFVVRKDVFEKIGRFDDEQKVAENFDLALRMTGKHVILHIPQPLVTVRLTDRSLRCVVGSDVWDYYYGRAMSKAQ